MCLLQAPNTEYAQQTTQYIEVRENLVMHTSCHKKLETVARNKATQDACTCSFCEGSQVCIYVCRCTVPGSKHCEMLCNQKSIAQHPQLPDVLLLCQMQIGQLFCNHQICCCTVKRISSLTKTCHQDCVARDRVNTCVAFASQHVLPKQLCAAQSSSSPCQASTSITNLCQNMSN